MSYSSNAAYLGLTREFPITKTLTFEADLDAGLAVTRAHGHMTTSFETGIQNDFLARSRYKAKERLNFSYGIGSGLSAKITPNVRVVGKVNFFDLGNARTGISDNLLSSYETLSVHSTAVSGSLGLRIKL
jgi:opacity protein-like surface antigen